LQLVYACAKTGNGDLKASHARGLGMWGSVTKICVSLLLLRPTQLHPRRYGHTTLEERGPAMIFVAFVKGALSKYGSLGVPKTWDNRPIPSLTVNHLRQYLVH
jgi:hypothetical protein